MKYALPVLSTLVLVAGFSTAASAGPRYPDRGAFVFVQEGYDGPDGGYGGGERREWRGRGEGRWHGRPSPDRGGPEVLSEGQVTHRLVRQGFVSIEDIRLRRGRYIIEAVRPNGALVRLAVDAFDGEILSRERIGWVRDGGGRRPGRGQAWSGPEDFDLGGGRLGLYGR